MSVGLGIENDRTLFPAPLPQLDADIDVLVGPVVASVMSQDLAEPLTFGIGQVGGHDIPADPSAGEVVERREQPGCVVRRVVAGREGHCETEVLGARRQCRDQQGGVDAGNLDRATQRSLAARPVHVIGAQHVGEEDPVEAAPLEGAHEVLPPAQGPVAPRRLIGGVLPHPLDLMIRGCLDEGAQVHLAPPHQSLCLGLDTLDLDLRAEGVSKVSDVTRIGGEDHGVGGAGERAGCQGDGCVDHIDGAGSPAQQSGGAGQHAVERDFVAVTQRSRQQGLA